MIEMSSENGVSNSLKGNTKTLPYNNDSDSDDKLTIFPKLSNFGSALISDMKENVTKDSFTNNISLTVNNNYHQHTNFSKNETKSIHTDYSSTNITSPKFKGIQNILEQELAQKQMERRKTRRIFKRYEVTSLGRAKRTNLDNTTTSSTNNFESNDPITSNELNANIEYQTKPNEAEDIHFVGKNKFTDNSNEKTSRTHVTTPSSSFGSTFHSLSTNPFTESNTYNQTNSLQANTMIDYNSIEIGDLNPFQVLKKYNLPSTELPTISKLYFEKQKEENRKSILKKRSASKEGLISSISSNTILPKKSDHNSLSSVKNDLYPRHHSSSTYKENNASNTDNIDSKHLFGKSIDLYNDYPSQREALALIDINKNYNQNNIDENKRNREYQPSFEKSKIHISESKELPNPPSSRNTPVYQDDKETHKKIKKVEIVEPIISSARKSKNVVSVNDIEYERIELLGRGGSSKVYKVKNTNNNKIYAMKRVVFDEFDDTSVDAFKGEIELLKKLENEKRVVKLIQYQMENGVLYLIMECGDHDLSQILNQRMNMPLDIDFIRYYSREMLKCVKVVHDAGIVHSDLKPANFVLVKGILKIIDFGIANAVPDHTVNIYRDTQIGTPNYMAPEALVMLNDSDNTEKKNRWKVGKPSDIWSCGCIMYQMFYGRPPYGAFQNQNRLLAIMNPEVKIVFSEKTSKNERVPRTALDTMKACLVRNPDKRWTADEILNASFLNPVMVTPYIVRDLIRNAVYYGSDQGSVTDDKIIELADDVLSRLADFRL